MQKLKDIDRAVQELLRTLPEVIRSFNIESVEEKTNERDLVTVADRGVEAYLTDRILKLFPDHQILGEESYEPEKDYSADRLWVIDPIDGTTNFVKQGCNFCTLLAYFEDGRPLLSYIYEPMEDRMVHAIADQGVFLNGKAIAKAKNLPMAQSLVSTDIRRMYRNNPDLFDRLVNESFAMRSVGTSGLDGCRVIEGRYGGYINYQGGPWDFAPFFLMAKELDLVFLTLDGREMNLNGYSNFILCNQQFYQDLFGT